MKIRRTNSQSGSAIVAALAVIVLVSALIGGMMVYTAHNARAAHRDVMRTRAIAVGDGVLEDLFDKWRYYMSTATDPKDLRDGLRWSQLKSNIKAENGGRRDPANRARNPKGTDLIAVSGTDIYEVRAATPMLVPLGDNDQPVPEKGARVNLRDRQNYLAKVRVSYSTLSGNPSMNYVDVTRVFTKAGSSIFRFFLFSTVPNTEIHPGALMKIFGKAYVEGNLYNAHDTLAYKGEVTFLGKMVTDYYSGDSRCGTQTPTIGPDYTNNWDVSNPPHSGKQEKVFDTPYTALDPNFLDESLANNTDSNNNKNDDGFHEMIEMNDGTGKSDPFREGNSAADSERLADNADYRIEVDAQNNLTFYVNDGTGKFSKLSSKDPRYDTLNSAVTPNGMMQDSREGATNYSNGTMRTVTLDVGKTLTTGSGALTDTQTGNAQDGLTLYVTDTSAGTSVAVPNPNKPSQTINTKRRALVITNGAVLPDSGLTIVTPHAAYVEGDYNSGRTGTTNATNPETNYNPTVNDSATNPDLNKVEKPNYDRKPAAIAADAINILSNNWQSSMVGTKPPAANTTINAALITGNVPSENGNYSGGIENFPRLHENWSGKYLTICGTLALMYNSNESTGLWKNAAYDAPNRRWYYDTNFLSKNVPGFRPGSNYRKGQRTTGM